MHNFNVEIFQNFVHIGATECQFNTYVPVVHTFNFKCYNKYIN